MRDQWTRRASFMSGLCIAIFASLVIGVADTIAALGAQEFEAKLVSAIAWRVMGLDLLLGLPLGIWVGVVLFGVLGAQPPKVLLERLSHLFHIGSREQETERLARTISALAAAGIALLGIFAAAIPIFSRIVRSYNAAIAIVLAAVLAVVLALSLLPALRHLVSSFLRQRKRIRSRQLGIVSLPVAILAVFALGGVVVAYVLAHFDGLFYGLELAPAWWFAGFAGALLSGVLLACIPVVERMLAGLSRPMPFVLTNSAAGLVIFFTLQVAGEEGAHAGLLDGSGVASRVFDTLNELSSRSVEEQRPPVVVEVQPEVDDTGSRAPDVIIITVDALRADHLGVYGYHRPTTPNIDAFATRATVFRQAYSAAPCTSSSFAGVLTSRVPSRIPGVVQENESFSTPESTSTFVEHFRRAGYYTVGYVPLVPKYLPLIRKGFDKYDNYFGNSTVLTDRIIDELSKPRQDNKPLLLWAHYLDVHFPYRSRPGWAHYGDAPIDLYDQEISYTDSQLARVFAQLQWLGYMEKSVVVLSADHGEAFMEHGTTLHGDNLYQEQIHVPLLIAARGLERGGEFTGRVSMLDLAPTLVDMAGIAHISYQTDGRSLLARLKGLDNRNPTILVDSCRLGSQFAVIGDHKLYFRRNSGAYYLYNLLQDPLEQKNLFHNAPDIATPLVKRLRSELLKGLR